MLKKITEISINMNILNAYVFRELANIDNRLDSPKHFKKIS